MERARIEQTPQALLSALSLEEKVALLHQNAPAIERLALAPFQTGTEALHGVAWLGTATVFPQPPGLAASWDPDLLAEVGDVVATEVRAKHASDPRVSLNVWAPVVNTLRHPLWGRGEEGYSEDPDVTAELATAYCRGLRGTDPDIWKTVPTLKHFLAYGNEVDRAATSSHLPPQTLREMELPAFRGPLSSGFVGAVMPSYNLVNGRPSHVCGELLHELRTWAPGSIAVVSDAQAPSNLVDGQAYFGDHVAATAAALRAGVDSFTDNGPSATQTIERVRAALEAGLMTEEDIDAAVLRLLELRERTGEFAAEDPYAIPASAIDLAPHRALAREAAARGVVVLANQPPESGPSATPQLPLRDPSVIAVVGPYADHVATDWYSGTPPYAVTIADAVRERYPHAQVRTNDGADVIALSTGGRFLVVAPGGGTVTASGLAPTSAASQFSLTDWGEGIVTLRSHATNAFVTGANWIVSADAPRVGGWVAQETFERVEDNDDDDADDGTRGMRLRHAGTGRWLRVQLGSGLLVTEADPALATTFDVTVVVSGVAAVAEACAGADAALVALGNEPHVHGRETADRPNLGLPPAMLSLWSAAREQTPQAVLTLVSSYPYAIPAQAAEAAAVVWSSHAGQELGHGLIDVLSGDRVPSGRLPQTWWSDEVDAGDLLDYDAVGSGQTYRYNAARPLYALGHGLGWTHVQYESIRLEPATATTPAPSREHHPARWVPGGGGADVPGAAGMADATRVAHATRAQEAQGAEELAAVVVVHNSGDREADELIALWAQAPTLAITAPRQRILAWTRVRLAPGERAEVRLPYSLRELAVWDVGASPAPRDPGATRAAGEPRGAYRVQPGTYRIASGPSASDLAVAADLTVTGAEPSPVALLGASLPAADFARFGGILTADRTRENGNCIETALSADSGWAEYDRLDLEGVERVGFRVARRRFPSRLPARVGLDVRAAAPAGRANLNPWRQLIAPLDVPEAAGAASERPYTWRKLAVDLDPATVPDGPVELRLELTGDARVADVQFDGRDPSGTEGERDPGAAR